MAIARYARQLIGQIWRRLWQLRTTRYARLTCRRQKTRRYVATLEMSLISTARESGYLSTPAGNPGDGAVASRLSIIIIVVVGFDSRGIPRSSSCVDPSDVCQCKACRARQTLLYFVHLIHPPTLGRWLCPAYKSTVSVLPTVTCICAPHVRLDKLVTDITPYPTFWFVTELLVKVCLRPGWVVIGENCVNLLFDKTSFTPRYLQHRLLYQLNTCRMPQIG